MKPGQRQRHQSPGRARKLCRPSSHAVGNMGARHSGQVAAASSPLPTQASMHAAWNACEQLHSSATIWKPSSDSSPAKQIAQTAAAPSASPSAASWSSAGCATRRRLYRGAVSDRAPVSHILNLASRKRSKAASVVACSPPQGCPGRGTSPWHDATPRRSKSTPAMKRRRPRRSSRSRRFRRRGSS